MAELLLELLSEEIPARMQSRAAEDLKRLVTKGLKDAGLDHSNAEAYATPRRLALVVDGIPEKQPDVAEERKGPQVSAPEKAVEGFLKSVGLDSVDQCETREIKGRTFYFAVSEKKGEATISVLAELFNNVFSAFPWPKSMRWGSNNQRWVRPLHSVLCLFDGKTVSFSFAGVVSGAQTPGHRFLSPGTIEVTGFADYRDKLNAAHVIVEPARRRELIETRAKALAGEAGFTLRDDPGLLDEVAGLVEWPVVMIGDIGAEFMDLPDEVLVTAMRHHQKYFSCLDADGNLAPKFIMVAGTIAADGGKAILAGNERVLSARLADARFFWDQDRRKKLKDFLPALGERVFHAKLGSMAEKVTRMEKLAAHLAESIPGCDAEKAKRAAHLAKADLACEMVGEFPELQGVMGRYYALDDGEMGEVAVAVADHYAPAGPNDACPDAPLSIAVALADKIDSLVGFFGIDEKPTGSKDPFALRRAALGVIRLILENKLRLPLATPIVEAHRLFGKKLVGVSDEPTVLSDLLTFFAGRLKVNLKDKGVRHDLIDAVFASGGKVDLVSVVARVEALGTFLKSGDGDNLLTAYKRAANIVRIEEDKKDEAYSGNVKTELLKQQEEKDLRKNLDATLPKIVKALKSEDFAAAMTAMSGLRRPIDDFFDNVTVNAKDEKLRENRLILLKLIMLVMNQVADFSRIEGGGH